MCIALLTTAHPLYKLILIDNRDEYINRPTATASFWPAPHSHVFGGRDLHRSVHGTWLGVTRTGRIAVLTNFREDTPPPPTAVSRGEIIKKFLTEDEDVSTEEFVRDVVGQGVARDAGGFSLVCGRVRNGEQLAVISNRAKSGEEVPWVCGEVVQTVGLSNASFGDRSWPKVLDGEVGMLRVVRENLARYPVKTNEHHDEKIKSPKSPPEGEDALIDELMDLLSDDALSRKGLKPEDGLDAHIFELRNTILVPPLGRKDPNAPKQTNKNSAGTDIPPDEIAAAQKDEVARILGNREQINEAKKELGVSGIYATQKQTVVVVDQDNRVRFVERSLFDDNCDPVPKGKGIVDITFKIEDARES